jgi:hypothetical protein
VRRFRPAHALASAERCIRFRAGGDRRSILANGRDAGGLPVAARPCKQVAPGAADLASAPGIPAPGRGAELPGGPALHPEMGSAEISNRSALPRFRVSSLGSLKNSRSFSGVPPPWSYVRFRAAKFRARPCFQASPHARARLCEIRGALAPWQNRTEMTKKRLCITSTRRRLAEAASARAEADALTAGPKSLF